MNFSTICWKDRSIIIFSNVITTFALQKYKICMTNLYLILKSFFFTNISILYEDRHLHRYWCSILLASFFFFSNHLLPLSNCSYHFFWAQHHAVDKIVHLDFQSPAIMVYSTNLLLKQSFSKKLDEFALDIKKLCNFLSSCIG